MMRKIRIAQIGLNMHSHSGEIFHTIKSHPEIFEVAGYALVEDERITCAHKIVEFDGYKELTLEQILCDDTIEAVAIETDEIHITKYALMAAEHGKHIHMEKPGSQSLEDFEKLIATVKEKGTVLHLGYMYRYNPYVKDCIERANKGEFGKIFSVETHMSRTDGIKVRNWLDSFKGGMMFYLGCHLIDLVLQIQGMPEEVIPFNSRTGFEGTVGEDNSLAILKYPYGYSIVRVSGNEINGFSRRQLVVLGEKATVEIRPLEYNLDPEVASTRYGMTTSKIESILNENKKPDVSSSTSEEFDRYEDMIVAFGAMVRGDKKNPYTLDYELDLFKTILKCCGIN